MGETSSELVAYCGLYCGDCHAYQGQIADLARDLRKELRRAKFAQIAPALSPYFKAFEDYDTCYEVLGAMVRLRCKETCRGGGGNPFCKIRNCCRKKEISGCWECAEFEECAKLEFLEAFHGDAHLKNLRRIRKRGVDGFLAGKRDW